MTWRQIGEDSRAAWQPYIDSFLRLAILIPKPGILTPEFRSSQSLFKPTKAFNAFLKPSIQRARFLFTILEWEWTECKMRAFFYSAFLFRNGQNAIPFILLPGAEWTECCEWKSKMADGEMIAADSNTSLQGKTLLLISLHQKYKEKCCDNGCNGSLFVGRHICYAMFTRPGPTGVFLCRQSELFLAFRTNHSYSRIVDKKTRPKC